MGGLGGAQALACRHPGFPGRGVDPEHHSCHFHRHQHEYGRPLRGTARQLALLQMGLKCVAAFILLILLVLELKLGWPLTKALVTNLSSNIGLQAAWVFLLYQLVGGLALTLSAGPAYLLLQRWATPSREEALVRPQYLFDQALDDAQTALDLVEREQAWLVRCLPAYLSEGDLERRGELAEPIPILLQANRVVAGQITRYGCTVDSGSR